jgi:DNA polymerase III alpha subunit
MIKDKHGQIILDEDDLVNFYYKNNEGKIKRALVSNPIQFDSVLGINENPKFTVYVPDQLTTEQFDNVKQSRWLMPDKYKTLDIAKWILEQCNGEAELQRAGEELLLYQEYELFDFLKYMKYLVDTMRENNIVWGVGRGSSVSSFVLFLIGIHKINSLYYGLDIKEFLR